MNRLFLIGAALTVAACATTEDRLTPAIEDFISVSELEEVDQIRHRDTLHYEELNENYVILKSRKDEYLIGFIRRCVELRDNQTITPDVRTDANILRSRFDTIRGCRIAAIYPINKGQADELRALGDSPAPRY